jgi:hypothetical protein
LPAGSRAGKRTALWYQIDATDSDPATFFYYLSAAAQSLMRKSEALPLPTSELEHDIASFARRYFRALFARLEPNGIVVLDNLQELSQGSPLYLTLAQSAEQMPSDGRQGSVFSWNATASARRSKR